MKTYQDSLKETLEEFEDIKSDIISRMGEDKSTIHLGKPPSYIKDRIDSRLSEEQIEELNEELDDIKFFLTQALEAEQAKREAMAREMIEKVPMFLIGEEKNNGKWNIETTSKAILIKIALKYGVEVE